MQEKKVIKYTREGIREENLATGETKMLTLSHYGQEIKYSAKHEPIYPVDDSKVSPNYHAVRQYFSKSSGQKHDRQKEYSVDANDYRLSLPTKAGSQSNGKYALARANTQATAKAVQYYNQNLQHGSGFQQKEYRIKTNGQLLSLPAKANSHGSNKYALDKTSHWLIPPNIRSSPKLLNGTVCLGSDQRKTPKSHRSFMLRIGESAAKDLQKNDNLGLSAVGSTANTNFRIKHGVSNIKSIQERRTTRRVARGAKTAAKRASKAVVSKISKFVTKQAGKVVVKVSKAVMNPAALKFLAIVGAIVLVLVIIFQTYNSFMAVLTGTTTDHPELAEYVQQLDNEFLDKIDKLKSQYEQDDDTTVKIEGDEQVNTDPNVLAILATGDWVVIDLTPKNKAQLKSCHGLLNTYTVTKTDEKVKEEISDSSGETTIKRKTIHHITIQVRVYTPEEIIGQCGYTDAEQKNVLDILDFLYQITGEIGNTPNTTAPDYYPAGNREFCWPVPGHSYISSGYGTRIDPITKTESAFHTGLDIPAPTGTSVLASADGTVIRAGWNSGFGNCVIIQHKNGVQTLYGHNSALVVKTGDVVKQGQAIAKVGSTGRSTGPHCHFEFRIKGKHVDPSPYLKGVTKE